jgi:hypothetical protein
MSCHRAELTSDLLEVSKEHVIRPEDIGRMIRKGYLGKPILGNSQVTVLLNQADDIDLRRTGEDIAKLLTPYSCVIAKLNEE